MKIRFTADCGNYKEGEEADLPDEVASAYVEGGYAEAADEPKGEDEPDGDEKEMDDEKALSAIKATIRKSVKEQFRVKSKPSVPAQVKDPKGGFRNFGDWLRAKARAYLGDQSAHNRLEAFRKQLNVQRKTTQGQDELDADHFGGDTVPEIWANELWMKLRSEFLLIDKFRSYQASGDVVRVPILNDTSRATGSRPLRYYSVSEGADITVSKMVTNQVALSVRKFAVFAAATRELLEDSNSNFEQIIQDQIVKELRFALNDLAINGSGSSAPTGLLNAACKITVSKESGQGSQTLYLQNLAKMIKRLPYGAASRAFFVYNRAILDQLITMAFDPSASSKTPAWGLTYNPADETPLRFQGVPMHELETCQTLGIAGDVILVDPQAVAYFMKPIEVAVSPHLFFQSDQIAYRGTVRFDQNALYTAAETQFNGNLTLSPIVVLESRGST